MTDEKPQRLRSGAYALVFTGSLPILIAVAREHGYALAVHGSMSTDLDIIACPWTEDAADAETLVRALCEAVNGHIRGVKEGDHNPQWKPHGRLAWSIYTQWGDDGGERYGFGPYLDVSVMPRRRTGEHYAHEGDEKRGAA